MLTAIEREVLSFLAAGLHQTGIAANRFISPTTVATHIQRILTGLGAHSRAEALLAPTGRGLVAEARATGGCLAPEGPSLIYVDAE
jgi:two-component system, NarL family, nitrate/nitrite response regulator NarL